MDETQNYEQNSVIPWYRKPSAYWIILPLFFLTITWSLWLAPSVQLNVKIVCYHYYKSRSPFNDTGDGVEDCNSKEVQSMASKFLAMLNLCSAIPAIFRAGPYGSLSDRKGRRIVLLLPTIGAVISTIINILVGTYYKSLSLYFLIISPLIDGITGGFLPVKAAFYAYATDCTHIERRNIVFSRLQSALFMGFAIGPLLGGLILKFTDSLLSGFYVNLTIYVAFCIFVIFILPESLSKETSDKNILYQKQMKDALKRKSKHFIWIWHIIDMFKSLLLFFPRKTRIQNDDYATIQQLREAENVSKVINMTLAGKYSLLIYACIQTVRSIAFMGSQTLFFLYTAKKFSWTAVEQGYFFFMMGAIRSIILLVVIPLVAKYFKIVNDKKDEMDDNAPTSLTDNEVDDYDETKMRRLMNFELWITRIGLFTEGAAYIGYMLASSGAIFATAIAFASVGAVASPSLTSLYTKYIPASQVGELMGALSLLDAILRVVGPTTFDLLYSALVLIDPRYVWPCFTGILLFGCLLTFGVNPKLKSGELMTLFFCCR